MIYDPHFLARFIGPKDSPKQRRLARLGKFTRTPRLSDGERKRLDTAIDAFRVRTHRDEAKS